MAQSIVQRNMGIEKGISSTLEPMSSRASGDLSEMHDPSRGWLPISRGQEQVLSSRSVSA